MKQGKAADIVCFDAGKAFTPSHTVIIRREAKRAGIVQC